MRECQFIFSLELLHSYTLHEPLLLGSVGYIFFSGSAAKIAGRISTDAANAISSYVPSTNFYLVPVIVSKYMEFVTKQVTWEDGVLYHSELFD